MKNHKLFLIILFISVIINPNFGQKGSWTIGLNSGLRGELFDASQHYRFALEDNLS
mgnify:CR=1 FL=1